MKKWLTILMVLLCAGIHAQHTDFFISEKLTEWEMQQHLKSTNYSEQEDYKSYDLVYHSLNFKVDPNVNYISGSVFSIFKPLIQEFSQLQFDMVTQLKVDSVIYHGQKLNATHQYNKLTITFPEGIEENLLDSLEVFYHGVPPGSGLGSFVKKLHAGKPIIWTLSQPYGARDWWPCKQSLEDKIDSIDIKITTPLAYKAASNGKLISDKISGTKRIAHWQHRHPIATYLVAIATTNYEVYSENVELNNGKTVEILNYMYPEYLITAKSKSEDVKNIMKLYSELLVEYPFANEKYGHAQFGWSGGMEHQTMSFMGNLNFGLVAHEMAHQWFGDYVTLGNWSHIWLNEGFATYFEGIAYERLLTDSAWKNWLRYHINKATSSLSGSVYAGENPSIARIFTKALSYSKGGMLLHMLRWELGDEAFFEAVRNYLKDPEMKAGFAVHDKVVAHFEATGDTTLTEFFNDWYYGGGFPNYDINYFYQDGKTKINVQQNTTHSSVDLFEMHLPVRYTVEGVEKNARLHQTENPQEFVLTEGYASSITFDPDYWLCAKSDITMSNLHISEITNIEILPEYPNKTIRVLMPPGENAVFRLTDLNGKLLMRKRLKEGNNSVEVFTLRPGIYIVEVRRSSGNEIKKIFWK